MKHHIIPRHSGGSDDPSNIEIVTPAEHAERPRILFETHGRWQDFLAWKGLAGLVSSEECATLSMVAGGRKGAATTKMRYPKGTRKLWKYGGGRIGKHNLNAKQYKIKCPDGKIIMIECLTSFCKEMGFKYNSFQKAVVERARSFRGYSLIGKPKGLWG